MQAATASTSATELVLPVSADIDSSDDAITNGGGCMSLSQSIVSMRGIDMSECIAAGTGGAVLATGK